MSRKIVRDKKVDEDLGDIWDYIAFAVPSSASPEEADRVLLAIENTFRNLADFPDRRKIPGRELFLTGVEGFPQYLLIYTFDDETLRIKRVFRGDLDWQRIVQSL